MLLLRYIFEFKEWFLHTDLVKAVPDHHKKFLADMLWVHEEVRLFSLLFPFGILMCFARA